MTKVNKKLLTVVLLVMILIMLFVANKISTSEAPIVIPGSDKTWSESSIFTNLEYQKKQKQDLKDEYKAFDYKYTLEDPYIKENPYSINPLSAYIVFESDEPVKYSYKVSSDKGEEDFIYSNEEYSETVVIPVLGLYEDTTNSVEITVDNKQGNQKNSTVEIITNKVDYNPVNVKIESDNISDNIKNGWFFDSYYNGFDSAGNIRYNLNVGVEDNYMKFNDGSFYIKVDNYQTIYEINIMGEIINYYYTPSSQYNFHHDLVKTKDGKVYALGSYNVDLKNIPYAESFIFEYDKSGKPSKIIDVYDMFDENLVSYYGTPNENDPIHINSIDYIEEENQLIISSQAQSFIAAIDATSNELAWVVQDDLANFENKDKALKVLNEENFEETSGQHTAFLTTNSKYDAYRGEGKYTISIFNNNNCKNDEGELQFKDYDEPLNQSLCTYDTSDVLIYAIDLNNNTVEQIDSFEVNGEHAPVMSGVFDADENNFIIHFNRLGKPRSYLINNEGDVLMEFEVQDYEGFGYYRTNFKSQEEIQKLIKAV